MFLLSFLGNFHWYWDFSFVQTGNFAALLFLHSYLACLPCLCLMAVLLKPVYTVVPPTGTFPSLTGIHPIPLSVYRLGCWLHFANLQATQEGEAIVTGLCATSLPLLRGLANPWGRHEAAQQNSRTVNLPPGLAVCTSRFLCCPAVLSMPLTMMLLEILSCLHISSQAGMRWEENQATPSVGSHIPKYKARQPTFSEKVHKYVS